MLKLGYCTFPQCVFIIWISSIKNVHIICNCNCNRYYYITTYIIAVFELKAAISVGILLRKFFFQYSNCTNFSQFCMSELGNYTPSRPNYLSSPVWPSTSEEMSEIPPISAGDNSDDNSAGAENDEDRQNRRQNSSRVFIYFSYYTRSIFFNIFEYFHLIPILGYLLHHTYIFVFIPLPFAIRCPRV